MPRRLRPVVDFHQQRFMQISESHCGPAVIQMLLSREGVDVTQEEVAEAGGATNLIALNGMRVDQLALAVKRLAPQVQFYYKEHATITELVKVVIDYHHPAGVEWQGLFEDDDEEDEVDEADDDEDDEDDEELDETDLDDLDQAGLLDDSESEDNDYGHYSVVVWANRRRRQLIIADPYKDYFSQARIFGFQAFDQRWYDYNEVADPVSGKPILVEDDHLMFVVAHRNKMFPRRMGMQTFVY